MDLKIYIYYINKGRYHQENPGKNNHQSDGPSDPCIYLYKRRNELAKFRSSIKNTHTAFPEDKKFGYAVAIVTDGEYRKIATSLDFARTFTNPTKPATYDQRIKTSTTDLKKSHK